MARVVRGAVDEGIDWRHRCDYIAKHGLTPAFADEAVADPNRLVLDPDPASVRAEPFGSSAGHPPSGHSARSLSFPMRTPSGKSTRGHRTPPISADIERSRQRSISDLIASEAEAAEHNPDAEIKPGSKVTRGHQRAKTLQVA